MSWDEHSESVNIDPENDIDDLFHRKNRRELRVKRFARRKKRKEFFENIRACFTACRRWFRYD